MTSHAQPLERFPDHPELTMDPERNYQQELLAELKGRLNEGPLDESAVRFAYALSREVGDFAVYTLDKTGNSQKLLERTRYHSRPVNFVLDNSDEKIGGSHNQYTATITINPDQIDSQEDQINKVDLKEGDGKLIRLLHFAAHEAGHAILSGAAHLEQGERSGVYIAATKRFMADRPDHGFTGNWHTDMSIHEERFAEGYATLVLSESLGLLGYSKRETNRIVKRYQDVSGEHGASQIDHIKDVQPRKSIGSLVLDAAPDIDTDDIATYEGQLGYAKPLTTKEVVEQLGALGKHYDSTGEDWQDLLDTPEAWHAAVLANQKRDIKRHLKFVQSSREAVLHPWRHKAKWIGGMALATSVLVGTEVAVIDAIQDHNSSKVQHNNDSASINQDENNSAAEDLK